MVQNGDFETYSDCPNGFSLIHLASHWQTPINHAGTSDFYHKCHTSSYGYTSLPSTLLFYQHPYEGYGLGAFITYTSTQEYREYLVNELLQTLDSGTTYVFKAFVVHADYTKVRTEFQVAFSSDIPESPFISTEPMNISYAWESPIITDTATWREVSFNYVATGKEKYMIIGNFKSNSATNVIGTNDTSIYVGYDDYGYILIDHISLIDCSKESPQTLSEDVSFCQGVSIDIKPTVPKGFEWQWMDDYPELNRSSDTTKLFIMAISDDCGVYYDSLKTTVIQPVTFALPNDTSICSGDSLVVKLPDNIATDWNIGPDLPERAMYSSGLYVCTQSNGCSEFTDSFTLNVLDPSYLDLGSDTFLCDGDTLSLSPWTDGEFAWEDTSSQRPRIFTSSTEVIARATNQCFAVSDTLIAYFENQPFVDLGPDTLLCSKEQLILQLPQNTKGLWNQSIEGSEFTVNKPGTIHILIKNRCGEAVDSIQVDYEDCKCLALIPNAFTPNADHYNNEFKPIIECEVKAYQLDIYNRWGERIFATKDLNTAWNGTYKNDYVMPGVYLYIITYTDLFDVPHFYKGTVHLIR
jgi:gliding motility-associated-like protein